MKQERTNRARAAGGYRGLIRAATGAALKDLALIEEILREEIFHSTLDWQSTEQFAAAAQEGYEMLKANREVYELDRRSRLEVFEEMQAASRR